MVNSNSRLFFLESQWNNAVSKLPPEKALEVLAEVIYRVRANSNSTIGIESPSVEQKTFALLHMGFDYQTASAIASGEIAPQLSPAKNLNVTPDQELRAMLLARTATRTETIPTAIASQWQQFSPPAPNTISAPTPTYTTHYVDNSVARERGWAVVTGFVVASLVLVGWFIFKPVSVIPGNINISENPGKPPPKKLERAAKVGDRFSGFTISSGFGWRIHPVYKTRLFHNGADIPVAYGMTYLMPGGKGTSGTVACWGGEGVNATSGGGGYVATVSSNDPKYKNMKVLLMHLKRGSCIPGKHRAGAKIAEGGSTGVSTGPHLHLTQKVNGENVPPSLTPIKEVLGVYGQN
jgi:murein DD-endopeptidase MepM/ murein hydrolase activator NlpD